MPCVFIPWLLLWHLHCRLAPLALFASRCSRCAPPTACNHNHNPHALLFCCIEQEGASPGAALALRTNRSHGSFSTVAGHQPERTPTIQASPHHPHGPALTVPDLGAMAAACYYQNRLGSVIRASLHQSDILILAGALISKMSSALHKVHNLMQEHPRVIGIGHCGKDGGYCRCS